jgi:hypothetical protein
VARGRSLERVLADHRASLARRHRVSTAGQLLRFVEACGFCYAFTLREGDIPIPACFDHLATRSVDRMWGWMWEWKDELPEAGKLYYGKLLRKKPTFVSMEFLPTFYATFGRAGEEDEYLEDVRAGRINDIARRIYEALRERGETQTKRLRSALGISSAEGRREYAKAMEELQRLMYVTRVRAVGEGREDYNYTYDLFTRRYPTAVRAAGRLSSRTAMRAVLRRAIEMAGAVEERRVPSTFEWEPETARRVADELEREGGLVRLGAGAHSLLVLPRLAKDVAA